MVLLNVAIKRKTPLVPVTTVPLHPQNITGILLKTKDDVCTTFSSLIKVEMLLKPECYMLSRQIYRYGASFRREKLQARMKQLKQLLLRFEELNIAESMKKIVDLLNDSGLDEMRETIHIPSVLVCEQFLSAMYRAATILHRAIHFCFEVRNYTHQQLSLEHYVLIMVSYYALVSRIWILCRSSLIALVNLYKSFMTFVKQCFQENVIEHTIKFENLPPDLQHFHPQEAPICENQHDDQIEDILAGYKLELFGINADTENGDLLQNISTLLKNVDTQKTNQNLALSHKQKSQLQSVHNLDKERTLDLGIPEDRVPRESATVCSSVSVNVGFGTSDIDLGISVQRKFGGEFPGKKPKGKKRKAKQQVKNLGDVTEETNKTNAKKFTKKNSSLGDVSVTQKKLKKLSDSQYALVGNAEFNAAPVTKKKKKIKKKQLLHPVTVGCDTDFNLQNSTHVQYLVSEEVSKGENSTENSKKKLKRKSNALRGNKEDTLLVSKKQKRSLDGSTKQKLTDTKTKLKFKNKHVSDINCNPKSTSVALSPQVQFQNDGIENVLKSPSGKKKKMKRKHQYVSANDTTVEEVSEKSKTKKLQKTSRIESPQTAGSNISTICAKVTSKTHKLEQKRQRLMEQGMLERCNLKTKLKNKKLKRR